MENEDLIKEYKKYFLDNQVTGNIKLQVINPLEKDFEKYFHLILSGKNIINSFFDSVMVMDKNEEIKNNRIAILKSLDIQFKKVADIKEIE